MVESQSDVMLTGVSGNTYFIENISKRATKLFFAQARKVEKEAEEPDAEEQPAVTANARKAIMPASKSPMNVRSSSPNRSERGGKSGGSKNKPQAKRAGK